MLRNPLNDVGTNTWWSYIDQQKALSSLLNIKKTAGSMKTRYLNKIRVVKVINEQ